MVGKSSKELDTGNRLLRLALTLTLKTAIKHIGFIRLSVQYAHAREGNYPTR
jgi:hypothetical protein